MDNILRGAWCSLHKDEFKKVYHREQQNSNGRTRETIENNYCKYKEFEELQPNWCDATERKYREQCDGVANESKNTFLTRINDYFFIFFVWNEAI